MAGLEPEGTSRDIIRLRKITARGRHGVLSEERRTGQQFAVDVAMHLSTRLAAQTDDLGDTVDYAQVAEAVVELISGEPVWLLERLAEQIAARVLSFARVEAVEVCVHKPQAPLGVEFGDVEVTIFRTRAQIQSLPGLGVLGVGAVLSVRPEVARQVVLALGANLGDPVGTLRRVVRQLQGAAEFSNLRVSPLARTQPVIGASQGPQPDYYNCVILGDSRLSAKEILDLAHHLEQNHGRVRAESWGPRTLDVDIVQIAGLESSDPTLTLPHPRAAHRAFVLGPWAALDRAATLGQENVGVLADRAPDRDGVLNLWEEWLEPGTVTGTFSLPSWQAAMEEDVSWRVVDDVEVDIIHPQAEEPAGLGRGEVPRTPWHAVRRNES